MAALSSAAAAATTSVRPFYFRTDLRYIRIFYVVKYYILRISFLALRAPRGRKPYRLKAVKKHRRTRRGRKSLSQDGCSMRPPPSGPRSSAPMVCCCRQRKWSSQYLVLERKRMVLYQLYLGRAAGYSLTWARSVEGMARIIVVEVLEISSVLTAICICPCFGVVIEF